MTLGGQPNFARRGVTLPLLVISGWPPGPRQGWEDGFRICSMRDNTSRRRWGHLVCLNTCAARICLI